MSQPNYQFSVDDNQAVQASAGQGGKTPPLLTITTAAPLVLPATQKELSKDMTDKEKTVIDIESSSTNKTQRIKRPRKSAKATPVPVADLDDDSDLDMTGYKAERMPKIGETSE